MLKPRLFNVVVIRRNATTRTQAGFASWAEAARAVAGWAEESDRSPVYIGYDGGSEPMEYTVGELRGEFA
jgi:hypothetical protein